MNTQTAGARYDELMQNIRRTEQAQSVETSGGHKVDKAALFRLYDERDRLLLVIENYGRNYIEGSNISPMGDTSLVSF